MRESDDTLLTEWMQTLRNEVMGDAGRGLQPGRAAAQFRLAFSPDGNQLASASNMGPVKMWDARQ